jgi:hypothetical protein
MGQAVLACSSDRRGVYMLREDILLDGGLQQDYIEKQAQVTIDAPCWHDHYLALWKIVKESEKHRNDEVMLGFQKQMKQAHVSYMHAVDDWLRDRQHYLDDEYTSPQDRHLKRQASTIRGNFEQGLLRYSIVYLYLNRYILQLRHDLAAIIKEIPKPKKENNITINSNVGFLLRRACRDKASYVREDKRAKDAIRLLQDLEKQFTRLDNALGNPRPARVLRGHIRKGDWDKAAALVKGWDDRAREIASYILKIYEEHKDTLYFQKQYVLAQSDIEMLHAFTNVTESRIDDFIQKYTLPYLEYKFALLLKQAYRLGQVGNFETLFSLYDRLLSGMTEGLHTDMCLKAFEGEVLRPIQQKNQSAFSTLPDILDEAEETVFELRALIKTLHEFL